MIPLPQHQGRTFAVFGLARSGLSAVRALRAGGAAVRAWDDAPVRREAALAEGATLADLVGGDWRGTAALVLSPGVPLTHPEPHPVVRSAAAARVPVIGDVELMLGAGLQARRIGITGTNGKSTTTALIAHVLKTAGRQVEVGGNLGTPVLDLAPLGSDGVYVLEMSSYQLDLTPSWHADVAVLLNVTPDHLDRHGSMAGYAAVKRRIFGGGGAGRAAIIGVDDAYGEETWRMLRDGGHPQVVPVAVGRRLETGVSVVEGKLYEGGAAGPALDLAGAAALPGRHNWQNAAAAFAATRALGLTLAEIDAGLRSFPGLAHRMERVAMLGRVLFVNDSKATNADAAAKALACYDAIYWIVGGRPKAGGLAGLEPYHPRIRHAFLIGEAAAAFAESLAGRVPAIVSGTLPTAVRQAYARAVAEDAAAPVVLLSPACASFDQFSDFEARGAAFRQSVSELVEAAA